MYFSAWLVRLLTQQLPTQRRYKWRENLPSETVSLMLLLRLCISAPCPCSPQHPYMSTSMTETYKDWKLTYENGSPRYLLHFSWFSSISSFMFCPELTVRVRTVGASVRWGAAGRHPSTHSSIALLHFSLTSSQWLISRGISLVVASRAGKRNPMKFQETKGVPLRKLGHTFLNLFSLPVVS